MENKTIHVQDRRALLMRYDTAVILKRFFFVEHSLILSLAGWIPGTALLRLKMAYARTAWQDSLTAEAMRQRVFELRFPSRLMTKEGEEPLTRLIDEGRNAPSALGFYLALIEVFLPSLREAYRNYLALADTIGDGPSVRFMDLAFREKEQQIKELQSFSVEMLSEEGQGELEQAKAWVVELNKSLLKLGGIGLDPVVQPESDVTPLPGRLEFNVAQIPARERAFHRLRFYWPDIIVSGYPYGEGLELQLRSALSHINEVWAVEAAATFTFAFAEILGWEFVLDGARWMYDEARHCQMGLERLTAWGFDKHEIPLGTYISDAARDADPIYRLGMLFFFETKNIHKKPQRTERFREFQDSLSEHDMDFDWADETKHAHFGSVWLTRLLEARGEANDPKIIRGRCQEMVESVITSATDLERQEILLIAKAMIQKAQSQVR